MSRDAVWLGIQERQILEAGNVRWRAMMEMTLGL